MSYILKDCITQKELLDVKSLLEKQGLRFEDKVTYTMGYFDGNVLIATGSLYRNVIKMIAVDKDYQHENITALIMTTLTQKLQQQDIVKYFLYTTPQNKKFFEQFSFSLIDETETISLLENTIYPIKEHLKNIKNKLHLKEGTTGAIIMNCNPVTLGHLHLIETCAKENTNVLIFLVEEDQSIFSFKTRFKLLKAATSHIDNVHIIPSTPYIISSATFPTYFLKELNDVSKLFMELDVSIFSKYFIPLFNIDYRYVGEEPLDPTTNAYNQCLRRILGRQLIIIKRLSSNSIVVSASLVRKLAQNKQYDELKSYVPKTTYEFLISEQGRVLFHEK
jgi:[citrate (pro-3S)-lyase] ligase